MEVFEVLSSCNVHDHQTIQEAIQSSEKPFRSDGTQLNALVNHLFLAASERKSETVLEATIITLASHLDWAVMTSNEECILSTVDFMGALSAVEEAKMAMVGSIKMSKAIFACICSSSPKLQTCQFDALVLLLDWNLLSGDCSILDKTIELMFIRLDALDLSAVIILNELFLAHPELLKRFLEKAQAVNLVTQLVAQLEISTEALHILQISSLVVLLTKERQLLEEETATRILKLATMTLESSEDSLVLKACCTFLSVACIKPILASRLRRTLMSGLLRRLFVKSSTKGLVPCIVELLINIFETSLLTPDFIPQHAIPLDMLLRWLNGHSLESWRAARLITAMHKSGFFADGESKSAIFEELKCVLNVMDWERSNRFGAVMKTLKLCLPDTYLKLAQSLGFAISSPSMSPVQETLGTFESYYFSYLTLFESSDSEDVDLCSRLVEFYELGMMFREPSSVRKQGVMLFARQISKKMAQDKEELLHQLRFISSHRPSAVTQPLDGEHPDKIKADYECEIERLKALHQELVRQCESISKMSLEKDQLIFNLELRLSEERAKLIKSQESFMKVSKSLGHLKDEYTSLKAIIAEDSNISARTSFFFNELSLEFASFQHNTRALATELSEKKKVAADLEDRLVMLNEEMKLLQEGKAELTSRLTSCEKEAEEKSHEMTIQIKGLQECALDLDTRLRAAQNQYHGCKEELMAVQLSDGQAKLELQSVKAMLDMKDQQVATYKEQVDQLSNRLSINILNNKI